MHLITYFTRVFCNPNMGRYSRMMLKYVNESKHNFFEETRKIAIFGQLKVFEIHTWTYSTP